MYVFTEMPNCPDSYTSSTVGNYCFLASTYDMPSSSAMSYCKLHGGVPVAIQTEEMQKAVQVFLTSK